MYVWSIGVFPISDIGLKKEIICNVTRRIVYSNDVIGGGKESMSSFSSRDSVGFEIIFEKRNGYMSVKEVKHIEFPVDGGLIIIFQGIAKITYVRLCKNDNIECC